MPRECAIVVTFKEHFPLDLVSAMLTSEFVGLCNSVQAGDDPRVLHLRPTMHEYPTLKQQLEELEGEGALTFIEEG